MFTNGCIPWQQPYVCELPRSESSVEHEVMFDLSDASLPANMVDGLCNLEITEKTV